MLPVPLSDATGTLLQAAVTGLHAIIRATIINTTSLPAPSGLKYRPGHLMDLNSSPAARS